MIEQKAEIKQLQEDKGGLKEKLSRDPEFIRSGRTARKLQSNNKLGSYWVLQASNLWSLIYNQ